MNRTTALRLSEFIVGLIFGSGLLLSGMTDPSKVVGFLDLGGLWDPSLALVMGGAIAVGFFAFRHAKIPSSNRFLKGELNLTNGKNIEKSLIFGSLIFGAGWGLAGFCPGPAIVSMAAGEAKAAAFVAAMFAGMFIFKFCRPR
jgi:uncharacterized protein